MFTIYKKHNNELYNKLVYLSRNSFFYKEVYLEDKIENRILLIFFHLSIILYISKETKDPKKKQVVFDNIFQNIEYTIRELGHGDVYVNKKMKNLSRIFYDILVFLDKNKSLVSDNNSSLLKKYFVSSNNEIPVRNDKLRDYFSKFQHFCFDLDSKNMLKGNFNFNYK